MSDRDLLGGDPRKFHDDDYNKALIRKALGDHEPSAGEQRSLEWLANWETETIHDIITAIRAGARSTAAGRDHG